MVIVGQVCDLGIRITWVQVSRLPMPHPVNDKWKCTMFTNEFYVSACHINKILQVNVFTGWTTQYSGINYNNYDNNNNKMHKMTSIPNSELCGSSRACNMVNKCSKFLLKGEYVEYIITGKVSKLVKVSVQANQSSMSVGYFFHSWYFFIIGGNHVIFIIQNVT